MIIPTHKIKRKIKQVLRRYLKKDNRIWVDGDPIALTLGENQLLPQPNVLQCEQKISAFPAYIALEVTNACNLECMHCNYRFGLSHYTRDRGFISLELVEKVLNEVKQYDCAVLMNYDGEPLMHKDFISFLKLATELKITSYFNTNGTLFNKKFCDELVQFYRGTIFFSIDGRKEWFERIRIPAKYEEVVGNLEYFLKANEAAGWPIKVGVSFCNFGQSVEDRKKFLDDWINKVNIVSMGEVNDKFGSMTSSPMTVLKVKQRPICVVPWSTCGVCFNGDIIPCSIYVTRANTANAIFGNIREKSIKEVWQGEAFNRFRKMVAEARYAESYCDKCQRWLAQFSFPDTFNGDIKIKRNGYWTTFQNTKKGKLDF